MATSAPTHDHADLGVAPRTRRTLAVVAAVLGAATLVGMLIVGFGTDVKAAVEGLLVSDVYAGEVTAVATAPCTGTAAADGVECQLVTVRLTEGPDAGEERPLEFSLDSVSTPDLAVGDEVVLAYQPDASPPFDYQYSDRQRRPVLIGLAVVFAVAVVLLGRLRGVAALAGLALSLAIIVQFVLPNILEGDSPVLVAVLGASAIAFVALYLAHGFTAMTTVALLGTLAALGVTIALSALVSVLAGFSGFASEEALTLGGLASDVDITGLLLAGTVLGALGAIDDMTVTQAASVAELRAADPAMLSRTLYRSSMRIGRDHVASTVNTLALAYAGAALPVLLLLLLADQSLGTVANSEVVAVEITRTLVGSIGLVASVPLTTWLAVRVVGRPVGEGSPAPVATALAEPPAPTVDDRRLVPAAPEPPNQGSSAPAAPTPAAPTPAAPTPAAPTPAAPERDAGPQPAPGRASEPPAPVTAPASAPGAGGAPTAAGSEPDPEVSESPAPLAAPRPAPRRRRLRRPAEEPVEDAGETSFWS